MTRGSEIVVRITDTAGRTRAHQFASGRTVSLGRDPACDVVLESSAISRRHVVFDCINGSLRISDVSSNGITVNGQGLHRACVTVGNTAQLQVGPYACEVLLLGSLSAESSSVGRAVLSPAQRRRVHRALLDHLDLDKLDRSRCELDVLRPRVIDALHAVLIALRAELPAGLDRELVVSEITDEALGLGPLEPLLADVRVTEIMVVDSETIFVERGGQLERAPVRFTDDDAVRAVIERIVTPLGRRIDESSPMVDARLKDGSRVNAVIPPLAIRGAAITIRRFPANALCMDDLVRRGGLSATMASLLQRAVAGRKNILIAGGTGSGKTTLLNVLAASIGSHERVVTIEDAAELRLDQPHVVGLESRPPNMEGKGAITIRDLVRNALRMRPDRIVVGECRGGEALDMLQAMNTGHDGSMTTLHASSPLEAIMRLETLCLMAGVDLPLHAIRAQIAASVHVIVQQTRFVDGGRRVTAIAEVCGIDDAGAVRVIDVFRFARSGVDGQGRVTGQFRATGFIPSFVGELLRSRVATGGDLL